MSRLIIVVLVVACSNNPKPAEPTAQPAAPATAAPAADPAPCEAVASHAVKISTVDDPKPFVELITRRCRDDLWSLDARKCYLTSNDMSEGTACEHKLTEAQRKLLIDEIEARGATAVRPKPTL